MIYLDHNSTTYLNEKALSNALSMAKDIPLNPSSIHSFGRKARSLLEKARSHFLSNLNALDYDIVFTSSGSESNNLMLNNFYSDQIFISEIEHVSIYEHLKYRSDNISVIKVDHEGLIDLDDLERLLRLRKNKRALVSVIYANNETGVIQDLHSIVQICRKHGVFVHSDLSQAIGKKTCDLDLYDLDFFTISGHKFGSVVGIGGLVHKKNYHLSPQIIGGGQEKGLRSGTQNVIGALSMAFALEDVKNNLDKTIPYLEKLRNSLEQKILDFSPKTKIASKNSKRLSGTSMIIIPNCQSQKQLIYFDLKGFAVSSGAACSSGKITSSRVLTAMNYGLDASCGIRVSLGIQNNLQEVESFGNAWIELFQKQNSLIKATGT